MGSGRVGGYMQGMFEAADLLTSYVLMLLASWRYGSCFLPIVLDYVSASVSLESHLFVLPLLDR